MQQTDANHCTTACTTTKGNDPRVVQPKTSIVCELHCLPAGFEHGRRACHPCRMQSEVFMHASMPSGLQAYLPYKARPASTKRASPRPSTSFAAARLWALASCARRMHAAIFSGASFSHGTFNGDRRRPVCGPGCACGKRAVRSRYTARAFDAA